MREALKAQGFGVLTEIDMRATLRDKLGQDIEDYLILGACNPPLAQQALGADSSIGLLLPCNVVVRAGAGQTIVEALDPQTMVTITGQPALQPVADAGRSQAQGSPGIPAREPRNIVSQPRPAHHVIPPGVTTYVLPRRG